MIDTRTTNLYSAMLDGVQSVWPYRDCKETKESVKRLDGLDGFESVRPYRDCKESVKRLDDVQSV